MPDLKPSTRRRWFRLGVRELKELEFREPVGDVALQAAGQIRSLRSLLMFWREHSATTPTDAGFAALAALPDLDTLYIQNAGGISDQGAARMLAGMPRLRMFSRDLATGPLAATVAALVRYHPVLQELSLYRTHLTDADLAILGGMKSLATLSIDGTDVTDAGLIHLGRIAGLHWIQVGTPGVTDAGLGTLGNMTGLDALQVKGARITDAGLTSLTRLPLKVLTLSGTQVTDAGMATVAGFTRLEWLGLGQLPGLTDAGLVPLRGLTSLEGIDLQGTPVSAEAIPTLDLNH